jgi:hypothetical protein
MISTSLSTTDCSLLTLPSMNTPVDIEDKVTVSDSEDVDEVDDSWIGLFYDESIDIRGDDEFRKLLEENDRIENGCITPLLDEGEDFVQPSEMDILSGRGSGPKNHPGNIRFMELVRLHKEEYASSPKGRKREISHSIVETLQNEGRRFLQFSEITNQWCTMKIVKALDKTSGAIRDDLRNRAVRYGEDDLLSPSPVLSKAQTTWTQVHQPSARHVREKLATLPEPWTRPIPSELESQLPSPVAGFRWALAMIPVDQCVPENQTGPNKKQIDPHSLSPELVNFDEQGIEGFTENERKRSYQFPSVDVQQPKMSRRRVTV